MPPAQPGGQPMAFRLVPAANEKGVTLHIEALFTAVDYFFKLDEWKIFTEDVRAGQRKAANMIVLDQNAQPADVVDRIEKLDRPMGYGIKIRGDGQVLLCGFIQHCLTVQIGLPLKLVDQAVHHFDVAAAQCTALQKAAKKSAAETEN